MTNISYNPSHLYKYATTPSSFINLTPPSSDPPTTFRIKKTLLRRLLDLLNSPFSTEGQDDLPTYTYELNISRIPHV